MNTGMIRVLSENSDFLVCLKPVGVDSEHALPALLAPDHGGSIFPVHRLDQGVGGVMVFAKNRESAAEFSRLIRDGLLRKEYVACCHGCPPPEGEMRDLLFKDSRQTRFSSSNGSGPAYGRPSCPTGSSPPGRTKAWYASGWKPEGATRSASSSPPAVFPSSGTENTAPGTTARRRCSSPACSPFPSGERNGPLNPCRTGRKATRNKLKMSMKG